MSGQIVIYAKDRDTADAIQQELGTLGIQMRRGSHTHGVSFGGVSSLEKMVMGIEIIGKLELLIKNAPEVVDAMFDTLDRFKDRYQLFIDGKPTNVSEQREKSKQPEESQTKVQTFEQFLEQANFGGQRILAELQKKNTE
jgi:hypothetical protein